MANSISRAVQSLIDNDPYIQDSLQRGYASYSKLARILKPEVEKIFDKGVKVESVVTAVKRARVDYRLLHGTVSRIVAESVVSLRTNVAKITVEKTAHTLEKVRNVLVKWPKEFLQVLEGSSAVTLIFDDKLFASVSKMFSEGEILDEKKNLAAITVNSPREIIKTPGCALAFYQPVSRKRVNIEETVSCFTDTIMVLPLEEVGEAFSALTSVIADARRRWDGKEGALDSS